jgi:chorismate-pyruvate lyase
VSGDGPPTWPLRRLGRRRPPAVPHAPGRGATDAVPGLGRVEQLVLRGDGLTTTSLEVLTGTTIEVRVRGHWRLPVPGAAAAHPGGEPSYTGLDGPDVDRCVEVGVVELGAAPGDVLLVRDVLLVGRDGTTYGAAEVVAAEHRLPDPVARALATTDQPIGRLLRDNDVAVRRELRRWGTLPAGAHAGVLGDGLAAASPVLGRVYRMTLVPSGEPLAALTEWFAPRLFDAGGAPRG